MNHDKFKFYVNADIIKGKDEKEMKIRGIASTGDRDSQNEFLDPSTMDLSSFNYINWNHGSKDDPAKMIGEPTLARINDKNELYIEGVLYDNMPMAKATYQLMQALQKSPNGNRLGMSVEGRVIERDPMNPSKITKSKITGVAICPVPVNGATWTELIQKGYTDDDEPIYDIRQYTDLINKNVEEDIEKAVGHKYFKREGGPGNYKYYYTEADYKAGKSSTSEPKEDKMPDKPVSWKDHPFNPKNQSGSKGLTSWKDQQLKEISSKLEGLGYNKQHPLHEEIKNKLEQSADYLSKIVDKPIFKELGMKYSIEEVEMNNSKYEPTIHVHLTADKHIMFDKYGNSEEYKEYKNKWGSDFNGFAAGKLGELIGKETGHKHSSQLGILTSDRLGFGVDSLKKSEEDDLEKAEGSRGGVVIGHTKSGKAIYKNSGDQADFHSFTKEDHEDAAKVHKERLDKIPEADKYSSDRKTMTKKYANHHRAVNRHTEFANQGKEEKKEHSSPYSVKNHENYKNRDGISKEDDFNKAISVEGTTGALANEGVDRKIEIEDVDGFDTKKKKKDKKEIDEKLDPKPVTLSKAIIYENIFNYFYIDEIKKAKQIYKLIENISIMEKTPITSESIQKALDILNIAQQEVEKSQDIEAVEEIEKAEVEDIEKAAKVKKAEEVEEKDEKEEDDDDKEEKENPFQKGFSSEVYKSAMSEMKAMIKKGMKKEDVEKAMDCNYSKSLVKAVAQECSLMDNKANGGEVSVSSISKSEIDEIVKSQLDEMIDIMKSSNDSFNEKFSAIGTIAKSQNDKIDDIVKSFEIISQENKALHERLQAVEKTSPGPKSMISKSFVDRFEAPTSTSGEVYNIGNRHDRSLLIEKSFDLAIKGDNEFADICTSLESTGKLTDRNLRKLASAGIKVVNE